MGASASLREALWASRRVGSQWVGALLVSDHNFVCCFHNCNACLEFRHISNFAGAALQNMVRTKQTARKSTRGRDPGQSKRLLPIPALPPSTDSDTDMDEDAALDDGGWRDRMPTAGRVVAPPTPAVRCVQQERPAPVAQSAVKQPTMSGGVVNIQISPPSSSAAVNIHVTIHLPAEPSKLANLKKRKRESAAI